MTVRTSSCNQRSPPGKFAPKSSGRLNKPLVTKTITEEGLFDATSEPLLAAVTFAASVIPTALGGVALSGIADRLPRREVMIACDIGRAGLVVAMVLPGIPIAALVGLLFLVTLISAPFTSARAALYPEILVGDRYVVEAKG